MAKRRKIQARKKKTKSHAKIEVVEDDRISELPDCILVHILSLLPTTKDAIRTGALSKRWKSLWTAVPNLVFTPNCNYNTLEDFVGFVNKALIQRGSQYALNKLNVRLIYKDQFKGSVDSWILYALKLKVEILEIFISNFDLKSQFLIPQYFYVAPYLKDLFLHGCHWDPPPIEPVCWKSLKTLNISHAKLSEDAIKNILSGSPVLENLELSDCYGFKRLEITSKSVKKFVFDGYEDLDDLNGVVEVYAPNIVSLDIERAFVLSKLFLRDISSVVEAKLNITPYALSGIIASEHLEEILQDLLQSLRHLNEVKIGGCSREVGIMFNEERTST